MKAVINAGIIIIRINQVFAISQIIFSDKKTVKGIEIITPDKAINGIHFFSQINASIKKTINDTGKA